MSTSPGASGDGFTRREFAARASVAAVATFATGSLLGAFPAVTADERGAATPMILRKCVALSPLYEDAHNLSDLTDNLVAGGEQDTTLAQSTGTSWIRIWADWLHMQPAGPESIQPTLLATLDANLAAARRAGLGIILVSRSYPLWANGTDSLVGTRTGPLVVNGSINEAAPWINHAAPVRAHTLEIDRPGIVRTRFPVEELRYRFPVSGPACLGGRGGPRGTGRLNYEWDLHAASAPGAGDGSAWYNWILFLATRYNATRGLGLPSPFRSFAAPVADPGNTWIDCLEIVNEPLGFEGWPQAGGDGEITTGSVKAVAQMFATAQTIVDRDLAGTSGPLILGPASEDRLRTANAATRSTTQAFTHALLGALEENGFNAARTGRFVWTHHNYDDFTNLRTGAPPTNLLKPDPKRTNSAALVRAMLVEAGWRGYADSGSGEKAPRLWLTEGGVDLGGLRGSSTRRQVDQAKRLGYMWEVMRREDFEPGDRFIGAGISMFTNWLFNQSVQGIDRRKRPQESPNTGLRYPGPIELPGSNGSARRAYDTWRGLEQPKVNTRLPPKPA